MMIRWWGTGIALALKLAGNSNAGTGLGTGKRYSIAGQNVKVYVQFQIKMARISYRLFGAAHMPHTPTPSQGRRRNRYRPSCLIREFLKAVSTDAAQITSTEIQLSVFLSFATHSSLLFLVWRSANQPKWRQKNNGTICVSMFIIIYSRKPQVNDFRVVISPSTVAAGIFGAYSRVVNCTRKFKKFCFAPFSQPQPNKSMCVMMSLLGNE